MTKEAYVDLWRWAETKAGKVIDKQCKDPSRAWARCCLIEESRPPSKWVYTEADDMNKLVPLDPDWAISEAPPAPEPLPVPLREMPDLSDEDARCLDPAFREELGHSLGGVVSDDAVRMVCCPRCRRESVWWWLSPQRLPVAMCNHRRSCGWSGPLAAFLEDEPIDDAMMAQ